MPILMMIFILKFNLVPFKLMLEFYCCACMDYGHKCSCLNLNIKGRPQMCLTRLKNFYSKLTYLSNYDLYAENIWGYSFINSEAFLKLESVRPFVCNK